MPNNDESATPTRGGEALRRARHEARARLKAMLARWPDVSPEAQRVLDALPYTQRTAVRLAYGERLSHTQIGARMGVGPRAVCAWLAQAHDAWPELVRRAGLVRGA